METVTIDYGRIGKADSFLVKLSPRQRGKLRLGQRVLVTGEGAPERHASVRSISPDGWSAELAFEERLDQPGDDRGSAPGFLRRLGVMLRPFSSLR